MGKQVSKEQVLLEDISLEIGVLLVKAAQRSLSTNWYHYRYIWTLISELEDVNERRRSFTMLSTIANELNIKYSR